ncbi:MAG TPA: hypothetical protein VF796_12545, partial [Humisphaera sp.]
MWIDRAVLASLTSLVLFAALAFGSVEPWAEAVVVSAAAAVAVAGAVRFALARDARPVGSGTTVAVVAFVALAALHLLPLPEFLLRMISPSTTATRAALAGPDAAAGPLSLYAEATLRHLRLLLAVAAVFTVVLSTFSTIEQLRAVLAAVAAAGVAVAALALAQDLTGATNVYWVGPPGNGGAIAGPFVHYSHYGQFANLTL